MSENPIPKAALDDRLAHIARFPLPSTVLAQHVIVLGKTRSGKSSAMRLAAERLLADGKPVCIIDPKGDWWGLRLGADGKSPGLPVVIFGGEHADVPINAHSGAYIGELVATGNRPCVIDLGGWTVADRTRFFIDFAQALFRHTRGPRHLFIDEAHNFAPQSGASAKDPQQGMMLHWANRLASEGSGKGITLISASQRPQKVSKDYVTSHETLIAMRVIHPLDRKADEDWISGCPDAAKGKEVLQTLATMQRGEGWVWSPEVGFGPIRIKFPMFSTYDSFAAPTGATATKLSGWAAVDLDEVKTKLVHVVEEAKANDPRELRAEIAELKRQLAAKPAAVATGDEALRTEVHRMGAQIVAQKRAAEATERALRRTGEATARAAFLHGVNAGVREAAKLIESAAKASDTIAAAAIKNFDSLGAFQIILQPDDDEAIKAAKSPRASDYLPEKTRTAVFARASAAAARGSRSVNQVPESATSGQPASQKLSPTARKILDVIHAAYPADLTFKAAALRAGASPRSSAYRNHERAVCESGEVASANGRLRSQPGFQRHVDPQADPVEIYASRLPPSWAAMLRAIAATNDPLTQGAIAHRSGVSVTSSGLSAGLRELEAMSLIVKRGDAKYELAAELRS